MYFVSMGELKRGYSASFDTFVSLLDKTLENPSDFTINSQELINSLSVIMQDTKNFQSILELNPDLKIGNMINANMVSLELYELSEAKTSKGLLHSMNKLIEKLSKEKEINPEVLKSFQEESIKLKLKVNDFIKFLENSGNLEIKNNKSE